MREDEIMVAATRRGLLLAVAILLAVAGAALTIPPALQALASFAGASLYGL